MFSPNCDFHGHTLGIEPITKPNRIEQVRDEFLLNIHFKILLKLNSPIIAPKLNVTILSISILLIALIIVEYKPSITSINANNTSNPFSGQLSLFPPCQGGSELLKLGTPQIWDLPSANYQATYDTFSIPNLCKFTTSM